MSSTCVTSRMPIKDPSLLTTLDFCRQYSESNTIEPECELYHTKLVHIHVRYTAAVAKLKISKIAGFKKYMVIASHIRPIDEEVSCSEDKAQDEELEGEAASTVIVPFIREGESDMPE